MKTITTIVLLLCSIAVYGQDIIPKGLTLTSGSLNRYYTRDTTYNLLIAKPAIRGYYFVLSNTKTVIRASYPDSTGLVKVWINKKEITWTTDSTFTYKTEMK